MNATNSRHNRIHRRTTHSIAQDASNEINPQPYYHHICTTDTITRGASIVRPRAASAAAQFGVVGQRFSWLLPTISSRLHFGSGRSHHCSYTEPLCNCWWRLIASIQPHASKFICWLFIDQTGRRNLDSPRAVLIVWAGSKWVFDRSERRVVRIRPVWMLVCRMVLYGRRRNDVYIAYLFRSDTSFEYYIYYWTDRVIWQCTPAIAVAVADRGCIIFKRSYRFNHSPVRRTDDW